jgi:acyl-CoA thioesterase-1
MTRGIVTRLLFALSVVAAFTVLDAACAASINAVAIGASNTAGKGVGADEAWPAVLERMLKAKGYDAHVTVRAVNGLTSRQIVRYANSLPPGTQVVIYDLAVQNDRRARIPAAETNANGAEIARRARAQGAVAIRAPFGYAGAGRYEKQADGRHFTPKAHRQIAAKLVPKVIAAARRR